MKSQLNPSHKQTSRPKFKVIAEILSYIVEKSTNPSYSEENTNMNSTKKKYIPQEKIKKKQLYQENQTK